MQDRLTDRTVTTPVVDEKHVMVGGRDGNLYWLSKADGALLGRLSYEDLAQATGVINPADVGRPEPHPAWQYHEDTGVVSTPVLIPGRIVIAYRNGVMAAFSSSW
jgi:outer membrane protein assembly factor BamB